MRKPQHARPGLGRPQRNGGFRPLRRAQDLIYAHAPSAALGGFSGLAAGAISGLIAGAPGLVAGALLGSAIGAAAGAALGAGQKERRQTEAALDAEIDSPSRPSEPPGP
jgi:hypothetical protein